MHTNRGYTGHEKLDSFSLVHMNGRIYDSRTARFLQADPFVQEPNNPQNFNRFTYLWNNPLNATDPSGYLGVKERQWLSTIVTVAAAVVFQRYDLFATMGATAANAATLGYFAAVGAVSGGIATQSWEGAMWGAFSSAVTAGFGLSGMDLWQQALMGGAVQGVLGTLQGGRFGNAFAAAGLSTMAGGVEVRGGPMGSGGSGLAK